MKKTQLLPVLLHMKIGLIVKTSLGNRHGKRLAQTRLVPKMASLLLTLSFLGCVHSPRYPEHWAPLTEIKSTEDQPFRVSGFFKTPSCGAGANSYLSGSYKDTGEISPQQEGGPTSVSLAHFFFSSKGELPGAETIEYIMIQGPENQTMEISAWKGNELIATKQFKEPNGGGDFVKGSAFECFSDGQIAISASHDGFGFGIGFGGRGSITYLFKAKDGALIARSERSSAGLILIAPFYNYSHQWYRFAPIP